MFVLFYLFTSSFALLSLSLSLLSVEESLKFEKKKKTLHKCSSDQRCQICDFSFSILVFWLSAVNWVVNWTLATR